MSRPRLWALPLVVQLAGCNYESHCDLEMQLWGESITRHESSCSIDSGSISFYTHDPVTKELNLDVVIDLDASTFAPGQYDGEIRVDDYRNGYRSAAFACVITLTEAELEPWTERDRWIIEGNAYCPNDTTRLSNVQFSVYVPEG